MTALIQRVEQVEQVELAGQTVEFVGAVEPRCSYRGCSSGNNRTTVDRHQELQSVGCLLTEDRWPEDNATTIDLVLGPAVGSRSNCGSRRRTGGRFEVERVVELMWADRGCLGQGCLAPGRISKREMK